MTASLPKRAVRKKTAVTAGVRSIASPRYHQVYVTLRTWVRDGTYKPGDQIPTEPQLCAMFDVSRITIRKAIDELAKEGWLARQQGKGTFVQLSDSRGSNAVDLEQVRSQIAGFAAVTEVRDLKVLEIIPDGETRAALALSQDEFVQRATHVRTLRGVPLGMITTYVPLDVAQRVPADEMARQPMFELLESIGIRAARADQFIGATLAGVEAAAALGVDVGAPLLRLSRVVFDSADRPVERVVALYRADAYQYQMQLRRSEEQRAL